MRRTLSLLLLMLAAVALVACGDDDSGIDAAEPQSSQSSDTTGQAEETAAETSATTTDVPAMFDFVAEDVRGGEVVGADFAGRDVVVWFWAPWCTKCNQEAPDMADLVADRSDDVLFLGMAGLADVGDMESFVERHGLSDFPHVVDADGAIWSVFEVTSQSVFVFVNDDGTVSRTEYGVQGRAALDAAVDDLLES